VTATTMTAATAMKTTAAMETAAATVKAAEAGLPARRESPRYAAMIKAAESSGVTTSESMLWAPVKSSSVKPIPMIEPTSVCVEVSAINENSAARHVTVMIEEDAVVMPVVSPMMPTPSKSTKKANAETETKSDTRARKVQPGIPVPTRPHRNRRSIDKPRIVLGHVNNLMVGRFDHNIVSVVRHLLLRRGL
jgi:hypothetical protein